MRWFFSMKRTIVSPSGMPRLSNSTISDGRSSALADTSPRYTPTHCNGCSLTRRGRSFESISADFENSRSPLAMFSGSLPRRDSIGFSGSVIRSFSLKRRCGPRHDPRQSRSSGRFRAEHDAESTALECRRHAATSASQSIEGRATLRSRATRARRPFSPDRSTDATRLSHAPASGLPRMSRPRRTGDPPCQQRRARCGGIDDRGRSTRQHWPEPRPVRSKRLVGIAHGERVVPEVDEHADAVACALDRTLSGMSVRAKIQGRTRRPWGRDDRTPYLPVWAVVRWVVLNGNVRPNGRIRNPFCGFQPARHRARDHVQVDFPPNQRGVFRPHTRTHVTGGAGEVRFPDTRRTRHPSWQSTRLSNGRITRSTRGGATRRSPLPATTATPMSGRSGLVTGCRAQRRRGVF